MKILKKITFLLFALLSTINLHFKLRILGNYIDNVRMSLLRFSGAKIGIGSCVHPNVMILSAKNLIIGSNSSIGSNSEIFNYSELIIGNNVAIGTQFYVNTNNHSVHDQDKPLSYQGGVTDKIIIGDDVWIGARVIVLSGVKIENRVVIGAGSVVTKNLETRNIYAGTPARKIKSLN